MSEDFLLYARLIVEVTYYVSHEMLILFTNFVIYCLKTNFISIDYIFFALLLVVS